MKKHIFSVPIFELKVDLDKIKISEGKYAPTWESGIPTTYESRPHIPKDTYKYLHSVIAPCLNELRDPWSKLKFAQIWRNKYSSTDYQGYHIHPKSQWSFIIYETVENSMTMLMNPAGHLIQNHAPRGNSMDMPLYYKPKLSKGDMILFPSWVGHQVQPGNVGTTIAGNIDIEQPPLY
jgi:hypothetical protein|tara:strand:- start:267 stop:800 length:534 start_codon:yes stop_codon:yes gene_type:complete